LSMSSCRASACFFDLTSDTSSTMQVSRLILTMRGEGSESCIPNSRLLAGFSSSGPGGGMLIVKLACASRCLKWITPSVCVKWRPDSADRGLLFSYRVLNLQEISPSAPPTRSTAIVKLSSVETWRIYPFFMNARLPGLSSSMISTIVLQSISGRALPNSKS